MPGEKAITIFFWAGHNLGDERSAAHTECGFDGLADTRADSGLYDQTIDYDLDVMRFVPIDFHPLFDLLHDTVDPNTLEETDSAIRQDLFECQRFL